MSGLRPYALLAPHLGGTGWAITRRSRTTAAAAYSAQQGPFALALAAAGDRQRDAFGRASAGFVGVNDGWQDFARHGAMSWEYASAGPGNVALLGELPRSSVLALAFGSSTESAATLALTALFEPFDRTRDRHVAHWTEWYSKSRVPLEYVSTLPASCAQQFHISTMVLRTHQDKTYPGAMVASLSIPWGNTKEEREGYHLVWPRDLVECAGALLAVGAEREAGNTLRYLCATQLADGHWNQNQWLGGKPYWTGIQLDETALPVLLAASLDERDALGEPRSGHGAARTIVHRAPWTGERSGSVGGKRGSQYLHPGRLHCRPGERSAIPARRRARVGLGGCGLLELTARGLDRGTRYALGEGSPFPATTCAWLLRRPSTIAVQ